MIKHTHTLIVIGLSMASTLLGSDTNANVAGKRKLAMPIQLVAAEHSELDESALNEPQELSNKRPKMDTAVERALRKAATLARAQRAIAHARAKKAARDEILNQAANEFFAQSVPQPKEETIIAPSASADFDFADNAPSIEVPSIDVSSALASKDWCNKFQGINDQLAPEAFYFASLADNALKIGHLGTAEHQCEMATVYLAKAAALIAEYPEQQLKKTLSFEPLAERIRKLAVTASGLAVQLDAYQALLGDELTQDHLRPYHALIDGALIHLAPLSREHFITGDFSFAGKIVRCQTAMVSVDRLIRLITKRELALDELKIIKERSHELFVVAAGLYKNDAINTAAQQCPAAKQLIEKVEQLISLIDCQCKAVEPAPAVQPKQPVAAAPVVAVLVAAPQEVPQPDRMPTTAKRWVKWAKKFLSVGSTNKLCLAMNQGLNELPNAKELLGAVASNYFIDVSPRLRIWNWDNTKERAVPNKETYDLLTKFCALEDGQDRSPDSAEIEIDALACLKAFQPYVVAEIELRARYGEYVNQYEFPIEMTRGFAKSLPKQVKDWLRALVNAQVNQLEV